MPATLKGEFVLVKTKTGRYCHPVRPKEGKDGELVVRLGCMEFPTHVWLLSPEELVAMEQKKKDAYRPCIACAMWLVYGQERGG